MSRRNFNRLAGFSMISVALAGCGLLDMPTKMDDTLVEIKSTNTAVTESNNGIKETNEAIHKQKLLLSLDDMFKGDHTQYLIPPTGMLAGGETFANEATTEEVLKLAFVWLKEIEKAQPDESLRGENGKFPSAVVTQSDHGKQIKWVALQVIAGLLPQSPQFDANGRRLKPYNSVEEIVESQVNKGGRYESTAYILLLARGLFIKDILVDPLFEEKITNVGKLDEAVQRLSSFDYLARLPFVDKIAFKSRGMLDPENNIDEKLSAKTAALLWGKLANAVDTQLESKFSKDDRLPSLMDRVRIGVRAWQ